MSEEEIIKNAKEMIYNAECWIDDEEYSGAEEREWAKFEKETIEGLLDLYNKEKSLNKILKSKTFKDICYNIGETDKRFISKEKLYKAIKELQDELGIAEELQDKI